MAGDLLVAQLFDGGEQQHLALVGGQPAHLLHELQQLDAVELVRADRQLPRGIAGIGVDRHVGGVAAGKRQLVHVDVVHDGEEPRAEIAARPPQPPLLPASRERVLDEIVGARRLAGQHARVAAQPRNGGDQIRVRQARGIVRSRRRHELEWLRRAAWRARRSYRAVAPRAGTARQRRAIDPTRPRHCCLRYLTTCQTLLNPSPVLSPGFWSFAHR